MVEIGNILVYNKNMKNLREIIPHNISTLRKEMGLTQMDLAKKVNYSDKAVSRWEKGEVLPDIETLQQIAKTLGVPLEYLFEQHAQVGTKTRNRPSIHEILFQVLIVCVIWTVLTIMFVYSQVIYNVSYWQVFVWGVPLTALFCIYNNRKWKNKNINFAWRTVFTWSFLTAVYVQFLSQNLWLVFIIGIPIQAAIFVAYFSKFVNKGE